MQIVDICNVSSSLVKFVSRVNMSEVDTHAVSSHDNPPANGDVAVTAAKDPEQKSIVDYPHDPHGIISTTNDAVVEREREERSLTPARASRGRSRSRQRRSKSRSRSRQRRRSKSRSRSRQRRISKSRSRSRQRRRRRSKSRSRSQSRRRYQRRRRSRSRSRSVSRDRWHRRRYRGRERWSRSRSRDRDRRRGRYSRRRSASRSSGSDGGRSARNRARDRMRMIEDPFTKLRSTATAVNPVQGGFLLCPLLRRMHACMKKIKRVSSGPTVDHTLAKLIRLPKLHTNDCLIIVFVFFYLFKKMI